MRNKYDKQTAVANLKKAIELIETDGDAGEVSNILIHTLGDGACDLNCIAANASFLQTIIDALPVPVYYKDIYGVYLGCNEALANVYGRKKSDIIGKTAFDFFTHDEAKMFAYSDKVLLDEESREMVEHRGRFSALGGSCLIMHKKMIMSSGGIPVGVLGIIMDISEQKQSEERAWQAEAFYKSLFEQSPRARVIFNSLNIIEDMNYAAFKLFGEDSNYVGGDITALFSRYSEFEKLMGSGGRPVKVEIILAGGAKALAFSSLTESGVGEDGRCAATFLLPSEMS